MPTFDVEIQKQAEGKTTNETKITPFARNKGVVKITRKGPRSAEIPKVVRRNIRCKEIKKRWASCASRCKLRKPVRMRTIGIAIYLYFGYGGRALEHFQM